MVTDVVCFEGRGAEVVDGVEAEYSHFASEVLVRIQGRNDPVIGVVRSSDRGIQFIPDQPQVFIIRKDELDISSL